jgi:hypothetical protein
MTAPTLAALSHSSGWPDATSVWRLRRLVSDIAATAADTARAQVLAYGWVRREDDRDLLYEAVAAALTGFLDSLSGRAHDPRPHVLALFRSLGEYEAIAGRSCDDLRAALSVVTGVVAERLTEQAVEQGAVPAPERSGALVRLGLAYTDRLQETAVAGHLAATMRDPNGAGLDRRRLVELLLGPAPDPGDLRALAADARWTVPRTITVIALDGRRRPASAARFLPGDVLSGLYRDVPCLIFPDPAGPGRRATLERTVGDHPSAVGPTVQVTQAALSLRLARRGLELLPAGTLTGPVHVSEHIPTLLLVQNPELTRHLAERKLAPLRHLRHAQRVRFIETLLAYFECGFNTGSTAARLHAHPQTVRNRIRQIEPLFGPGLYDPAQALDYLMALYAWRLSTGTSRAGTSATGAAFDQESTSPEEQGERWSSPKSGSTRRPRSPRRWA